MPRNLINQIACDAEPMLGEVKSIPARRVWLPAFASEPRTLHMACWQTRAARGLSWNRSGNLRGIHR